MVRRRRESRLMNKFKEEWSRRFPNTFLYKIASTRFAALPFDLIGCVNGKFVAIELKTGGRIVEPHQFWNLSKVAESGGFAFFLREGFSSAARPYSMVRILGPADNPNIEKRTLAECFDYIVEVLEEKHV